MYCPKCDGECRCPAGMEMRAAETQPWREEVAERVRGFRQRRRPRWAESMALDFEREATVAEHADRHSEEGLAPNADMACAPQPAEESAVVESNVIEFPRTAECAPEPVAEPMPATPRIFEAEDVAEAERMQAAFAEAVAEVAGSGQVPSMTLGPAEASHPADEIELPLPVAPLRSRTQAAGIDAAICAAALALATAIAAGMGVSLSGREFWSSILIAGVATWALYEYLYISRTAATLGMRWRQLVVATMDGKPLRQNSLRVRGAATALSLAAGGMGLFWALVDSDRLTWHDRISQTFLTELR